jgi:hypothetical protein
MELPIAETLTAEFFEFKAGTVNSWHQFQPPSECLRYFQARLPTAVTLPEPSGAQMGSGARPEIERCIVFCCGAASER